MRIIRTVLMFTLILVLLGGCTAPMASVYLRQASGLPLEPEAGQWKTWVLPSSAALRPAPPPDAAATQTELQTVRAAVAGRTAADLQQIAYWDAGSPSYRWIELAFAQNRATPAPGPRVMRMMSLLNVAIYDATVAAWDAKYAYDRLRPAALAPELAVTAQHTNSPSYPSEHAAAAGAASAILAYLYPDAAQEFLDKAQAAADSRVLAGAHFPSDVEAGLELGRHVAEQVIARAELDKAIPAWDGVIPTGPGYWTGEKPVEPTAGQWKTWVIAAGEELRAEPPLAYDSPELAAELQEVTTFTRTWQTNQKAAYWQLPDGAFQSWYDFAALRMFEQGLDANAPLAARIYALMSVAHYDAIVACWDSKYAYWYFRPFQMDAALTTVFPTPNYPSYPSGHACASTAMSEVLAAEFPGAAETIRARTHEALESRIWAGIHFRHELVAGQKIGMAVADKVLAYDRTVAGE